MEAKTLLVNNIKEWVTIDSKIQELQKQVKDLKSKKKTLSDNLIKIMENNDIDRFDTKNGNLIYRKTKVKASINKDYLLTTLANYFKEYPEIDVGDVGSYILNNRPIKENSLLVMK
tara:strand:+ start:107 stop:454 length:348 start_codon:yes stop_codon:yes gene_type:complete